MPCDTHGPFPFGAVRDLLGIARALYRAERATAALGELVADGTTVEPIVRAAAAKLGRSR